MKQSYIDYLSYTLRYSEYTTKGHNYVLSRFDGWLNSKWKNIEDPENIKLADVYSFIEDMSKIGLTAGTCAWFTNAIKGYLKYCKNILELDIVDYHKIKAPKTPERKIWFFSKDEKEKILREFNQGVGIREIKKLRNKLLTYMLLHTGLRCHEIAKIKVCEIWENLQVIGKWGKRRFVFLRPEILDMIYLYLAKRKRESDYLFEGNKGHITTDCIRRVYYDFSKKMGMHIHPHAFRHTFATDALHVQWSNVYIVAKLLGHKNISTTQIYLGTDNVELKKIQFWLTF